MLQNAYFLAKIGADTAENEQRFAEILPIGRRVAVEPGVAGARLRRRWSSSEARARRSWFVSVRDLPGSARCGKVESPFYCLGENARTRKRLQHLTCWGTSGKRIAEKRRRTSGRKKASSTKNTTVTIANDVGKNKGNLVYTMKVLCNKNLSGSTRVKSSEP